MATKRNKLKDAKTFEEALADVEQITPKIDPDEYLIQSFRDEDKVTLIMSLVRIAEIKREREILDRLRRIQMIPRNMWTNDHMKELLSLRGRYTGKETEEAMEA